MQVGIAADHAGFELKNGLTDALGRQGEEVTDFGSGALRPDDDYPDVVIPLAEAVARGQVECGIAVCGSGVGAAIAANKVAGVRAALAHNASFAREAAQNQGVNVICLGAQRISPAAAWKIVQEFLRACSRNRRAERCTN